MGEASGGDIEGPVSGSGTDITLPGSGIRVDSVYRDLADGEDTELKVVLELIKGT